MTFTIITAGIDLSVGSLLAVAGVAFGAVCPEGPDALQRRHGIRRADRRWPSRRRAEWRDHRRRRRQSPDRHARNPYGISRIRRLVPGQSDLRPPALLPGRRAGDARRHSCAGHRPAAGRGRGLDRSRLHPVRPLRLRRRRQSRGGARGRHQCRPHHLLRLRDQRALRRHRRAHLHLAPDGGAGDLRPRASSCRRSRRR